MDPLTSLALATAAFVGTHLLLSHPLRSSAVARLGESGFAGLYSLIAFATLGWMIYAYRAGDPGTPLWIAPLWAWWVGSAVLLIASILLVGSVVRNPAFPTGAAPKEFPAPKGVFAITRHPMMWSFMLWAVTHLALIGTPRNVIVAGGILLLAMVGSIGQDAKKARLLGERWRDWQARTSFVPFGALARGKVTAAQAVPGAVALIGGTILWAVVTWLHAPQWSLRALLG